MFLLTRDLAQTSVNCRAETQGLFSDSACTISWSHPSIVIGAFSTGAVDGVFFNNINILLDLGFPSVNLYIKLTTNG